MNCSCPFAIAGSLDFRPASDSSGRYSYLIPAAYTYFPLPSPTLTATFSGYIGRSLRISACIADTEVGIGATREVAAAAAVATGEPITIGHTWGRNQPQLIDCRQEAMPELLGQPRDCWHLNFDWKNWTWIARSWF